MKTSVSLSVFPAAPGMPVLFSGATDEHLACIRQLGYDGVDLFVRDPADEESRCAAQALRRHGLGVGVVMPAALAGEGLFLSSKDAAIRDEAIGRIGEIIAFAAELGGMVSLGLVRGSMLPGEAPEVFFGRFEESCRRLLELSTPLGVPLLVEPINRYEINNLNSSMETLAFLKQTGLALGLMLDTFHMNIEDVDLEESFRSCAGFTRHIHFLDSNRLAPGMGHMDMTRLYRVIAETGYQGYLCLEALPRPSTLECARRGTFFFTRLGASSKAESLI